MDSNTSKQYQDNMELGYIVDKTDEVVGILYDYLNQFWETDNMYNNIKQTKDTICWKMRAGSRQEKKNGALVRLGVRPQHLKIDDRGPIEGKVTMIERLGTETVVELISPEKTPFRFVSADTLGIKVSESVRFNFDPQLAHLF